MLLAILLLKLLLFSSAPALLSTELSKHTATPRSRLNLTKFELVYVPTNCPKANPIEGVFGDVHDKCTGNHKRKRLRELDEDERQHFRVNGPWKYKHSESYYSPEVTATVEKMAADERLKVAA